LSQNSGLPDHFFDRHLPQLGWVLAGAPEFKNAKKGVQGVKKARLEEYIKGMKNGKIEFQEEGFSI